MKTRLLERETTESTGAMWKGMLRNRNVCHVVMSKQETLCRYSQCHYSAHNLPNIISKLINGILWNAVSVILYLYYFLNKYEINYEANIYKEYIGLCRVWFFFIENPLFCVKKSFNFVQFRIILCMLLNCFRAYLFTRLA